MGICAIDDCSAPIGVRQWCRRHYHQKWSRGDFGEPKHRGPWASAEALLWRNIDKRGPDECWPWTACRDSKGYGKATIKGQSVAPHRMAYELTVGPIPVGLQLDHLCLNPPCCNPAHLEPVTNAENMRRRFALQTHCKRGHEFTPENTGRHPSTGARVCRTCQRQAGLISSRKRRAKLKAERGEAPPRPPRSHCKQGHPYDEKNTYWYADRRGFDRRGCRKCRQDAAERWKQKRAEQLLPS